MNKSAKKILLLLLEEKESLRNNRFTQQHSKTKIQVKFLEVFFAMEKSELRSFHFDGWGGPEFSESVKLIQSYISSERNKNKEVLIDFLKEDLVKLAQAKENSFNFGEWCTVINERPKKHIKQLFQNYSFKFGSVFEADVQNCKTTNIFHKMLILGMIDANLFYCKRLKQITLSTYWENDIIPIFVLLNKKKLKKISKMYEHFYKSSFSSIYDCFWNSQFKKLFFSLMHLPFDEETLFKKNALDIFKVFQIEKEKNKVF